MKKFAALFTDSYRELKKVRTVTVMAMFAAISVVLGYFTVAVGDYIKIGFASVVNQFVYFLFGPVAGGIFGGALDVLKYFIKPTGAFFPGFTFGAMVAVVPWAFTTLGRSLLSRVYITMQPFSGAAP